MTTRRICPPHICLCQCLLVPPLPDFVSLSPKLSVPGYWYPSIAPLVSTRPNLHYSIVHSRPSPASYPRVLAEQAGRSNPSLSSPDNHMSTDPDPTTLRNPQHKAEDSLSPVSSALKSLAHDLYALELLASDYPAQEPPSDNESDKVVVRGPPASPLHTSLYVFHTSFFSLPHSQGKRPLLCVMGKRGREALETTKRLTRRAIGRHWSNGWGVSKHSRSRSA